MKHSKQASKQANTCFGGRSRSGYPSLLLRPLFPNRAGYWSTQSCLFRYLCVLTTVTSLLDETQSGAAVAVLSCGVNCRSDSHPFTGKVFLAGMAIERERERERAKFFTHRERFRLTRGPSGRRRSVRLRACSAPSIVRV